MGSIGELHQDNERLNRTLKDSIIDEAIMGILPENVQSLRGCQNWGPFVNPHFMQGYSCLIPQD